MGEEAGRFGPIESCLGRTPIEFVHSLGSLYQASGATQTAVSDAYQQFRQQLERSVGISQSLAAEAPGMSVVLAQRFGAGAGRLQQTLVASEQARGMEKLSPKPRSHGCKRYTTVMM